MLEKAEQVLKFWNKAAPIAPNIFRVFWNVPDLEREGQTTTLEITDLSHKVLMSQQKLGYDGDTGAVDELDAGSLESDVTRSKACSLKTEHPVPMLGKRLSFNATNSASKKSLQTNELASHRQLKKR